MTGKSTSSFHIFQVGDPDSVGSVDRVLVRSKYLKEKKKKKK
jgi:hypothetical protein